MKANIIIRKFAILPATFFIFILLFILSLSFVFCLPESSSKKNLSESLDIINQEGREWVTHFTYTIGSRLDNVTDATMLESTVSYVDSDSPVVKAMSVNYYERYWHGYLIWLKPLMIFLNYSQVRYLYMFIHLFLFCSLILKIDERLDRKITYSVTFSLASTYFTILPFSLQYSSVYFLFMGASLFILINYKTEWKIQKISQIFMIIGMLTNFLDFLTAPLLTLGIPLLFLLLLHIKEGKEENKIMTIWKILFSGSILWGIGYGLTWVSKWILASIILKENIFSKAINQAIFRSSGSKEQPVDRILLMQSNLETLLPPGFLDIPKIGYIILILVIIIILLFIQYHRSFKTIKIHLPILVLATYPYIWYQVMGNHSQLHIIFTYRIQIISFLCLITFYLGCVKINFKKKK